MRSPCLMLLPIIRITIKSNTNVGAFYALQTLRSLAEGNDGLSHEIPTGRIVVCTTLFISKQGTNQAFPIKSQHTVLLLAFVFT